ncbi:hypothetical protein BJ875DRAFT_386729 [Amylocarpus encephaloides]|uniref:Calpain catalytic domain-containing protein n=1 Tax=Amylocarpus encephaloides TaxID=45428 RepID=A0A9P7Y9N8_9HELO|nr:hypothetical protein BJ875DRAFT_386729 [Amylocarpus encephaloides]
MSSSINSSASDNDSRQQMGPPPPYGTKPKPKKKKRVLPPQKSISKIWSRFSVPRFSKATTILPPNLSKLANSKPSPREVHYNLLVSEDFERAVQECRNRVKKLIRECKRVNMRYRDADFDTDWDLKWEKGYCLNGLSEDRFEISGRSFANLSSNVPKAVKRVHEIFENPTFKEKVTPADVRQGGLGDCWLMASLTALASMENGIHRICVEYDTKIGIYGFVFHRDGEWIISIIDDKLYLKSPDWDSPSLQRHLLELSDRDDVEAEYRKTYQTGSQALFFAHCADQNETWLPLLEKAYAKAHGDYGALQGGWNGEGVEDLTGGVTTELLTSDILDTDKFWTNEIMKVNKEFLFGCSTGLLDGGYGNRDGISEGHAYVVMEARELSTGERLLKLRNPWGKGKKGNWEGAWSDGSKEFTPEAQIELKHKFGNDSVFWISYPDLLRKYQHFDRTRLFTNDADWRITQRWISVDVPWKSEYEHKFQMVLTKESPVVLVLSQLDDRYFDGLQGQYDFRLQFRLHDMDSPDEEDFIVRSHGNYLMARSVVAELTSLQAGSYSVWVMVIAERNLAQLTVEEVVKTQCKEKIDNDKLAQVGAAYDLAHSKVTAHIESKLYAEEAQEKTKARDNRTAARRKHWEMRHLQRDVFRKQGKKNQEKRDLKRRTKTNEAIVKERAKPKDVGVQTQPSEETPVQRADRGVQTEEFGDTPQVVSEPTLESQPLNDLDKAVQTDPLPLNPSIDSLETPDTPKIVASIPNFPQGKPRLFRMPSGQSMPPPQPPPHFQYRDMRKKSVVSQRDYRHGPPPQAYITSEGESSASPISDFDDLFGDDEPAVQARPPQGQGRSNTSKTKGSKNEGEAEPDPWNAVCVVGFRVYAQDQELELKICDVPEQPDQMMTENDADDEKDSVAQTAAPKSAEIPKDTPKNNEDTQETKDVTTNIEPTPVTGEIGDAAPKNELAVPSPSADDSRPRGTGEEIVSIAGGESLSSPPVAKDASAVEDSAAEIPNREVQTISTGFGL